MHEITLATKICITLKLLLWWWLESPPWGSNTNLEIHIRARPQDRTKLRIRKYIAPFSGSVLENSCLEGSFFFCCPFLLRGTHQQIPEIPPIHENINNWNSQDLTLILIDHICFCAYSSSLNIPRLFFFLLTCSKKIHLKLQFSTILISKWCKFQNFTNTYIHIYIYL